MSLYLFGKYLISFFSCGRCNLYDSVYVCVNIMLLKSFPPVCALHMLSTLVHICLLHVLNCSIDIFLLWLFPGALFAYPLLDAYIVSILLTLRKKIDWTSVYPTPCTHVLLFWGGTFKILVNTAKMRPPSFSSLGTAVCKVKRAFVWNRMHLKVGFSSASL